MARELLADEPAFRAAIERCDAALPPGLGWTVREQLLAEPGDGALPARRDRRPPADAAGGRDRARRAVAVVGRRARRGRRATAWARSAPPTSPARSPSTRRCASSAGAARSCSARAAPGRWRCSSCPSDERGSAHRAVRRPRLRCRQQRPPLDGRVRRSPTSIAAVLADCAARRGLRPSRARSTSRRTARRWTRSCPSWWRLSRPASRRPSAIVALLDGRRRAAFRASTGTRRTGAATCASRSCFGRDRRSACWRTASTPSSRSVPTRRCCIERAKADDGADGAAVRLGSLRRGEPERASLAGVARCALGRRSSGRLGGAVPGRHLPPRARCRSTRGSASATGPRPRSRCRPVVRRRPDGTGRRGRRAGSTSLRWEPAPLTPSTRRRPHWLRRSAPTTTLGRARAALADARPRRASPAVRRRPPRDGSRRGRPAAGRVGIVIAAEPRRVGVRRGRSACRTCGWPPRSTAPPRLWWVTRGAHVVAGEPPVGPCRRAGRDLGRGARGRRREHPRAVGRPRRSRPGASPRRAGRARWPTTSAGDGPRTRSRCGAGDALRASARRRGPPTRSPARAAWRTDAAYLVTGGLGGVGRSRSPLAMVRDGARRLRADRAHAAAATVARGPTLLAEHSEVGSARRRRPRARARRGVGAPR